MQLTLLLALASTALAVPPIFLSPPSPKAPNHTISDWNQRHCNDDSEQYISNPSFEDGLKDWTPGEGDDVRVREYDEWNTSSLRFRLEDGERYLFMTSSHSESSISQSIRGFNEPSVTLTYDWSYEVIGGSEGVSDLDCTLTTSFGGVPVWSWRRGGAGGRGSVTTTFSYVSGADLTITFSCDNDDYTGSVGIDSVNLYGCYLGQD
ncbi:hypothetical protein MCOR07_000599 [Pyricularia oryzae]|uniref:Ig-like domain-containing protein n=5 Tax=Pyricularia TaxID=48558 RepID=A0ABQ8NDA8_PYRGI|nr:uncharacterized protein MGG_07847 [Pyricularia oryzae 70-15]KAH8848418.1 hypothetical protein MCOR01_001795 [Pyricularia oryzae]KAI6294686.1 hypothetical protein MCOR33_008252 [Pyricularia grisea]EHA53274.1 hypothetical protein MGG_07847 [Pyricularia oryzae 70-15]KAI6259790.1 hypothetical protein MCOR19_003930 [Pyricularia oryzae]KAI6278012.1 hypothetical protein MCOR26_004885 [Pyricularia oryzae]